MLLEYNGLALNLVRMDAYERVPVYHGPNYLYTRHKLTLTAVFNPATQQAVLAGDAAPAFGVGNTLGLPFIPAATNFGTLLAPVGPVAGGTTGLPPLGSSPTANTGRPAAYTASAIKHELMQPRGQLRFSVGGVLMLLAPLPGTACDATNGPTPLDCSVTAMTGTRTFRVRFSIQADINESLLRLSPTNFGYVLSHRWSMQHDLDSDFFVKRVIHGRLVFRADMVQRGPDANVGSGFNPDDFRRFFFHPIPTGWARRGVRVKALDDEVTVDYEVTDQQLPVGWSQANVTRVSAVHRVVLEKPSTEQTLANAALEAARIVALPQVPVAGDISHTALALGILTAKTIYDLLPVMQHSVLVEVWGNPNSLRSQLQTFAEQIATARIGVLVAAAGAFLGGARAETVHQALEKHVTYGVTYTTGPIGTLNLAGGAIFGNQFFPDNDDTGNLLQVNASPNGPPDDQRSRGTYLENCVAGALTGDAAQNQHATANPPSPNVRQANPQVHNF